MPFDRILAHALPYVPKAIVRRVASPYVAGETQAQAFGTVRGLSGRGIVATLDILGESVTDRALAESAARAYLDLLDAIARERIDSNVSLKLTQLGLKLDRGLSAEHLRAIVERAKRLGNFVRVDMEDSSCTDDTLALARELRREYANFGLVLQAMLKRTPDDARALAAEKVNVRVCKGIYIEPPEIAWRDRDRVRESFARTVEILLRGGAYVGIATHDDACVAACEAIVRDLALPKRGAYEFQMLLGVREALRDAIVARGHLLRVYVPFGSHWYAYSLRRLRENPAIARHVALALLKGRR